MKTSNLYSLNLQDVGKGFVVAFCGAGISAIQSSLNAGWFAFNWRQIGMTALAAGLAYLIKNFFTPSKFITHDATQ